MSPMSKIAGLILWVIIFAGVAATDPNRVPAVPDDGALKEYRLHE